MIHTERLDLVPLPLEFLRATRAGDRARAAEALGFGLGPEWRIPDPVLDLRIPQLEREPSLSEWLLRGMILRSERRMVGHVGFHSRPAPDYLAPWCPDGVELGYTVFGAERRRGFAREAAEGLMAWAARAHGVRSFVVSVSPKNLPSVALAARMGFVRVGSEPDPLDGPEDILVLDWPRPSPPANEH
ncbi:MAG: GNAT family N-acetyltransferase [Planctomycetes bacterium]|nr:GNAT family N-acetyltransferase [Planctomycetota bacterium]